MDEDVRRHRAVLLEEIAEDDREALLDEIAELEAETKTTDRSIC